MPLGMLHDSLTNVYYLFINAFFSLLKEVRGFYFIYLIIVLKEFQIVEHIEHI